MESIADANIFLIARIRTIYEEMRPSFVSNSRKKASYLIMIFTYHPRINHIESDGQLMIKMDASY